MRHGRLSLRRMLACGLLLALGAAGAPARANDDGQTQLWVNLGSAGLESFARAALAQIQGADRQLLALRAYLRAGASLAQRWTWSSARLSSYEGTREGQLATADIDAVSRVFARENPGFSLRVNRIPRSFQLQLEHWNQNPGVARVAQALQASMRSRFGSIAAAPSPAQIQRALVEWTPASAAPLAAPGLSAHGQGRAFDFQVVARERIIATTSVASARQNWDASGWTRRLERAVRDSGRPFVGPLPSPYEPWHYAYAPPP